MYDEALDLCNDLLEIYFKEYNELSDAKRNKMKHKYNPTKSFLETCSYHVWFENEELSDTTRKSDNEESVDLSDLPPLKGDEKVKKGKRLTFLAPKKLLIIRLHIYY